VTERTPLNFEKEKIQDGGSEIVLLKAIWVAYDAHNKFWLDSENNTKMLSSKITSDTFITKICKSFTSNSKSCSYVKSMRYQNMPPKSNHAHTEQFLISCFVSFRNFPHSILSSSSEFYFIISAKIESKKWKALKQLITKRL
jgi:hypothetical protein